MNKDCANATACLRQSYKSNSVWKLWILISILIGLNLNKDLVLSFDLRGKTKEFNLQGPRPNVMDFYNQKLLIIYL